MKHKLQKAAALTAVFLCLSVCTVPAYAQTNQAPAATAAPTNSPQPTATPVPSSKPEETPDTTATPKSFAPGGTGTLVDEAADTDGKEFYTIRTPDENVFYLVIDKQRGSENVYFLNAVTEQDLQSLAQKDKKTETVKPEATPTPKTAPTPTPEPVEKKSDSNMGVLLFVLAVVVLGGCAGYYFKIYRPKHQVPELEESEFEDEIEEAEPADGETEDLEPEDEPEEEAQEDTEEKE